MALHRASLHIGLAIVTLALGTCFEAEKAYAKKKDNAKVVDSVKDEVRQVMKSLKEAALKGNGQKMASLWTEDARYVDDTGAVTIGRAALAKRFDSGIENSKAANIQFVPDSIRKLSKSVVVTEGTVHRKNPGEDGMTPSTRYLIIFNKVDGRWLISSATETAIEIPEQNDYLKNLSWMIGDWSTKRNGGTVKMSAKWIADKNFIQCKYDISKPDKKKVVEAQLIGWDPMRSAPISWHFDASGGYGKGLWEERNNKWNIQLVGVSRDGSTNGSTNVISNVSKNSFNWQSINRTVNGEPAPDSVVLNVNRVTDSSSTK